MQSVRVMAPEAKRDEMLRNSCQHKGEYNGKLAAALRDRALRNRALLRCIR